jgi:DNA-binding MarR family transcriptional regulator
MSIEAMNWAYKQDIRMVSKYILVTLSNQADEDGKCWPSINYIAKRTGASRRTVIAHLRYLEEKGFVRRRNRQGSGNGRKSNVYYLSMGQGAALAPVTQTSIVQQSPQQEAAHVGQGAAPAPKQSINNQKNNQLTTSNAMRFDDWWVVYPKKVEKKKAKAIWIRRKLDPLADVLIEDTSTRPSRCSSWQAGYVPNPTTYLTGDRWEDEPIKAKANGNGSISPLPINDDELEQWARVNHQRPQAVGETKAEYRQCMEKQWKVLGGTGSPYSG